MPNWTTNKMRIHKNDLHLLVNGKGVVDFNILVPMPKSLDIGNVSYKVNRFAMDIYAGRVSSVDAAPNSSMRYRLTYTNGERGVEHNLVSPSTEDYREFGKILSRNLERYATAIRTGMDGALKTGEPSGMRASAPSDPSMVTDGYCSHS